ncbi:MAG: hypothetical protein AB7V59_21685 [Gammaproteobacteria bacterium]
MFQRTPALCLPLRRRALDAADPAISARYAGELSAYLAALKESRTSGRTDHALE